MSENVKKRRTEGTGAAKIEYEAWKSTRKPSSTIETNKAIRALAKSINEKETGTDHLCESMTEIADAIGNSVGDLFLAVEESTKATQIHGSSIGTAILELVDQLAKLTEAVQHIQKNTRDIADAMNEKKRNERDYDEE